MGGADAGLDGLEGQELRDIAQPQSLAGLKIGPIVGGEPDIRPFRPVEELAIPQCGHLREHILQEHHASPADMADDDIGHQPLPPHGIERLSDAMADSRMVIGSSHVPGHMRIRARTRFRSMSNDANGRDLLIYGLGDEADLIAQLCKLGGQGSELPETPSMNKRHVHRVYSPTAGRTASPPLKRRTVRCCPRPVRADAVSGRPFQASVAPGRHDSPRAHRSSRPPGDWL
jgi:hypothetical protein